MLLTALSLLADCSLYGVTLCLTSRAVLPRHPLPGVAGETQSRRRVLALVGATAGTLGLMRASQDDLSAYDGMTTPTQDGVTWPLTPNSDQYVVTQNASDPTPSLAVWRLEVTGLVGKPGS